MAKSAFRTALVPIVGPLPANIAQSIGRTIARHSYLEWVLGQVLYSLLEISVKQGRAVVKLPSPAQYVDAVKDLLVFHKIETAYPFEGLCIRLEKANLARNALAHSVYMREADSKTPKVHIARGPWGLGQELERAGRREPLEAQPLDRALIGRLRKDVEAAVRDAEKLQTTMDRLLRSLHDRRRTLPRWNRRGR